MSKLFLRLMAVASMGMVAAACQDDGYGAPRGAYQPAPAYGNPYYNTGYAPAPARYGYGQPAYGYAQRAPNYNPAVGRRYTTVTVTNRGQQGYRDDVVQQQVVCGSQYYDGYRTRTAPRC
jgi:hypothetical protein